MRSGVIGTIAVAGILALAGGASATRGSHAAAGADSASLPLVKVHFEFRVEKRATFYTVVNTGNPSGSLDLESADYKWTLTPPVNDATCNNKRWGGAGTLSSEFAWHHGNVGDPISDDGCHHDPKDPTGHQGDVDVVVKDANWSCTAGYTGTEGPNGNASGDGLDGECEKIAPPPRPRAPDCDEEKAALAAAEATIAALLYAHERAREAFRRALQQTEDALKWLREASKLSVLFDVFLGGVVKTDVGRAIDAEAAAEIADSQAEGRLRVLEAQLKAAYAARTRAKKALDSCLAGKSNSRSSVRRAQAASSGAVCGSQQIALAQAQARLSAYGSVARSFGSIGLAGARAKLLDAQRLLAGARSKLPPSAKLKKLARALDTAAASSGVAAAGVGKLIAVVGQLSAKVKPAQQQVAKAKSALAACQG